MHRHPLMVRGKQPSTACTFLAACLASHRLTHTMFRCVFAGTIKLWSVDTLQPERTESGDVSLSHKGPDVLQQELQSMEAKDPDTCYTTVQFTSRNLLLAAGYVNA